VLGGPQVAHRLVGEDHRRVVEGLAEHSVRRVAVAQDRQQTAQQDVVDDDDAFGDAHGAATYR
jgi:hypothetical protein